VGNRIDVCFQDGGDIRVKNIARPIRIWKWQPSATNDNPRSLNAVNVQPNFTASIAKEPIAIAMRLDPHYPDIVLHFLAQTNFSLGKYETAAQQLSDRIARNPATDASRMLLASCYGHLGRAEDARAVWAELLKVNPEFSLTQRARVLPYKNANDFQRILEGLLKVGLR
jgi:tetratricopeptide (TPR) repeat protein